MMMMMMKMTMKILMMRFKMKDRVFFGNLNASWKFSVNISIIGRDIGDTGEEEGSTLMMLMKTMMKLTVRVRMKERVFFGNLNASWNFRVNICKSGWDIGDTGVEEGTTLMVMFFLLRVVMVDRGRPSPEPHHHPPPLPCHPLNPTTIPLPSHAPKSGIWVEWLGDGLVGTSREISMAGRPFEEPPHQLFGLLVCLSSFCTELKYLKMPFFQFLAKTFITLEPFERFWKFKCLLIPFSKQYLLSSWFSWQQGVWMH